MLHSLTLTPPQGGVEVWPLRLSDLQKHLVLFVDLLNHGERQRYDRFTNTAAKNGFAIARGVLRLLLGKYLQQLPAQVTIQALDHGKPVVAEKLGLHFNLSHSHDLVLLAFADARVGVDVEFSQRRVDFNAIMRRFFSETEQQDWLINQTPTPEISFFRGWTRKEAILKATGEGIAGLEHTEVSFSPNQQHALVSRLGSTRETNTWFFQDFTPATDYQAAVAVNSNRSRIVLKPLLRAELF